MELSTASNVGVSIKKKQERLYTICHDYLIDNFHKFTEANKIKVALVLSSKMAPQQIEGSYQVNKMPTVKVDDTEQELTIGNRITNHIETTSEVASPDN